MDRRHLSAISIQELGELFMDTLQQAGPELLSADLEGHPGGTRRHLQRLMRPVMGRVVETVLATIAATQATLQPSCDHCDAPLRLIDLKRERQLQGLVGDYTLRRPYFVCDGCHRGRAPVDERLGLGRGSLSPGLSRVAARLGIEGAFGEGSDVLAETLGVEVAKEGVRRITEGLGAVAEAEQQAMRAAARQGEIPPLDADAAQPAVLAVEVDGIMVHTDAAWHEAKVGTVAPLGPEIELDPDTERERLAWGNASYCVGIEEAEDFWFRTYVEACRRGLTQDLEAVVVLGDGAEWIWKAADRFLGIEEVEVVEIVDYYHAVEHLWRVANVVFGAGTPQAHAWAQPLKRRLLEEGALPVITALQQLMVSDPLAAEEVRQALGYFTTNAARMSYPAFVARRLPIGSGAVESAGKLLVGEREKGAGMRWTRAGAQAVATLRALHRSGRWHTFWQTQPQRRRPAVFPRPLEPGPSANTPSECAA
jgi:hypothetical protein